LGLTFRPWGILIAPPRILADRPPTALAAWLRVDSMTEMIPITIERRL
jgi:hypothetical protein